MPTHCISEQLEFEAFDGHKVVAGFDGGAITSDAGALLLRHVDKAIGLFDRVAACFVDRRDPILTVHSVRTLVGQRIAAIALGYEDVDDHDTLRHDPALALLSQSLTAKRDDCSVLAGKSTLNRLELSRPEPTRYHKISCDGRALETLFVDLFVDAHDKPLPEIVLDLDATDDPLHGQQEGRFFHGYYNGYCYLPLYIFCGRHLLSARLRRSNIDASAGAAEEVERIVTRIRQTWPKVRIILRADSGFAREELMVWCEANRVDYIFGLARNKRLETKIAPAGGSQPASRTSGQAARVFRDFMWSTRDSWSRGGGSSPRPNGRRWAPTRASSSPRSSRSIGRHGHSTKTSTAPAATWRTGSRSASSTSTPTAPAPTPCAPISSGCGLHPSRTC